MRETVEPQILAKYDNAVFQLVKEESGYIFRMLPKYDMGCTGHHTSIEQAIMDAIRVNCMVFKQQ